MTETSRKRLRANLAFDIEAEDYIAAADHQRRLEEFLGSVKSHYPMARLIITERRGRGAGGSQRPRGLVSGALSNYADD